MDVCKNISFLDEGPPAFWKNPEEYPPLFAPFPYYALNNSQDLTKPRNAELCVNNCM